jgi:hypothetical protein
MNEETTTLSTVGIPRDQGRYGASAPSKKSKGRRAIQDIQKQQEKKTRTFGRVASTAEHPNRHHVCAKTA